MLVVIEGKWGSDFFLTNGVLDSVFVTLILFCFVLFCFVFLLSFSFSVVDTLECHIEI